ncbi:MAG TPA: asparagine synthase (glutamine-hydrolyzing) [Puia sp.]|jgi:asparagine synthase (glutamine-hydrolysing)|nr:asparagine synthase (glutamine-hydrolyzing) [Puia sp.]
MCGIAGFINFQEADKLAEMAMEAEAHRGPDSRQAWSEGNVTFAHLRLSIIDLGHRSDQPFIKDGLVMVFNGEIYNYKELRAKLLETNPSLEFRTDSDTEVLLEWYRFKREDCLADLIGMFAFAIYDQAAKTLFLARDHFGIKPLFYTFIGDRLAFASELKALVNIPGFNRTINRTALVGAMTYLWVPGNDSMFEGCYKLPPAHYMQLDVSGASLQPGIKEYWRPETRVIHTDEEKTIGMLTECMEASVRRHMIADVPVSSFLSGGLDSSLISVMAAQTGVNLSTYTIGTSEEDKKIEKMPADEKYARLLADQFHFDHHEIVVKANIIDDLPRMVYTLDEPIGDPAALNTYLICKSARENGVKVLLSGMGADELFFGYRRQRATLLASRYQRTPAIFRKPLEAVAGLLPVKAFGKGIRVVRWLKRFLSFAGLSPEEAYMRSYSYYDAGELKALFRPDVHEQFGKLRDQHKHFYNDNGYDEPRNKMCYTDMHLFMVGLNLTYTDRASMAASVEVRVPFIDREVVQAALHISGSLKYKKKQQKYILKKVAEKYLPHSIIYRPKASFGAPIRSWISNDLKGLIDELLSEQQVNARGLFNYTYIKKLIEEDRKGVADHAYRLYQLITLELWLRRFADQAATSSQA